jgi:trimethylamine--corrinoid protein Co-methyltransferase
MEIIHAGALQILETVGMRIDNERALDYLEAVGVRVDRPTMIATFPREVVQRFVAKMAADYADPDRVPGRMAVRYSQILFSTRPISVHADFTVNTGGFCCFIYDLDGNRRLASLDDVRRSIRLADVMPHIDFIGLPVAAQEIPSRLRPVVMAAELVKNTRKLGGIETFSREDVHDIIRIAEVVCGSRDELRKRPCLVGYAEARSPLCLDRNMADIFMDYIEAGLPQSLDTMPNAGATAPATCAGTLALGIAETLGGLALGYAVDENAVISIDICPSMCDMQSCIFSYGNPGRLRVLAASVQMINEFYRRPGGCHGGKTDACSPGVQAGFEKALSMLVPVLFGAVGIGTVGHLENAVTFSPQQLVIDNEFAGAIRQFLEGFEVSEETLALDVIREVGIEGAYLAHPHTAENFRKEFFLSDLFECLPWDGYQRLTAKGMEARALDKARNLWIQQPEPILEPYQIEEIDAIVQAAYRERS